MADPRNSSTYAAGAVIFSNDTPGFDFFREGVVLWANRHMESITWIGDT